MDTFLTPKQEEFLSIVKNDKLDFITLLEGAVRSGKTFVSLIAWIAIVVKSPYASGFLMVGNTITTLEANVLLLLQELVGKSNFSWSIANKRAFLFGKEIALEGAKDKASFKKITGRTISYAYADELVLMDKKFFDMLVTRLSLPGSGLLATTNPDHPRHWLREYIDNGNITTYQFKLTDNTFLPESYVNQISAMYTGVFYERYILGKWVKAEGVIYRIYLEHRSEYDIPDAVGVKFKSVTIGLDIGGSTAKHAIVATGMSYDNILYVLYAKKYDTDITADQLAQELKQFIRLVTVKYTKPYDVYCDHIDTVINTLQDANQDVNVMKAYKLDIMSRIQYVLTMLSTHKIKILDDAYLLRDSLEFAVWGDNDKRLDDDTTADIIDILDAFEYSIECHMKEAFVGVG